MTIREVPLSARVQSVVVDSALLQGEQSRLDLLDAYLALPADHPHPQIKRIRDEHASRVATYLVGLRSSAALFLRAVDGVEPDPVMLDVSIRRESDDRITLDAIGPALLMMLNNGVRGDSIRAALVLAEQEMD